VISVLQGERWKRSFTSSPLNNSHWRVKCTVKQKPALFLSVFQFSVARHVSEPIKIYKMDTDIDKMVHFYECVVNTLHKITTRFNIWKDVDEKLKVGPGQ